MQAAKDAVKNFTSKDGRHDTTVHEKVNPAVQNETVTRNQQDRVTTAVDKEVHQDHYHTSVQPINHNETLPEKHHHNLVGVEHRNFEHDDASKVKQRLAQEQAQFKDSHDRVEGKHTTHAQPSVAGEHVHHHVHENIQPVINKQTVEPHVVHTTVPIHEVHHNAAQHHSASALPAMSMDEFKKNGGALSGRETRTEGFDGCPKTVGDPHDPLGMTGHGNHHNHGSTTGVPTTGSTGIGNNSTTGNTTSGGLRDDRDLSSSNRAGAGAGAAGIAAGTAGTAAGATGSHGSHGTSGHGLDNSTSNTSTGSKPSLMDRINPTKDSDGDGKKGFMK